MKGLAFLLTLLPATFILADGPPSENRVATQFREHLAAADQNKDGFVTQEELVAEIAKATERDPQAAAQIASSMIADLDKDHDGKLSAAEIEAGAREAGVHAAVKLSARRSQ